MLSSGEMTEKEWVYIAERVHALEDIPRLAMQLARSPRAGGSISMDTIHAIYNQAEVRKMMKTHYRLLAHGPRIIHRYLSGNSLLSIAKSIRQSPVKVARLVMEVQFKYAKKKINIVLRDPSKMEDARFRKELEECLFADTHCSPRVDVIRSAMGFEYEQVLFCALRNIGLEFEDEYDLRRRKTYKTPDVLLKCPIGVNGRAVKWIDSKAKFGDPWNLDKDYEEAASTYTARFGPGMIIYWFGFVNDCVAEMHDDVGVLLTDAFPKNVLVLEGSSKYEEKRVEEATAGA